MDSSPSSPADGPEIQTTSKKMPEAGIIEPEAVSLAEKKQVPISPPVPDGEILAWTQCAAAFCIFFNTWGLLNSFGAFQAYYESYLLRNSSPSDISWIGTLQSSFILMGSVYSGPLYDQGYLRSLISFGSFMLVFGMFMTSLGTQYWHQILSQGLVMGLGLGCLFMSATAIVASYFTKRRGLAMGIASSGSTIGGILYPTIFSQLINKIHFGWTIRVIAFIMLSLSILPVLGMKMRSKPPAVRRIFDAQAWKEPVFTLYAMALFVGYTGMYIPYFYVQEFCLEKEIIIGSLNSYLLPIINAAGFSGRIFFGHLADKIGPLNAFGAASGVCSVLLFGWMGMMTEGSIIVFCILYGFFSAGIITLSANVVASVLAPDMRQFGVRLTMQLVPSALGLLIGNPIAGAILSHEWLGLQGFAASTVSVCTLLTIAARVSKVGWGMTVKI